MVRDIIDCRTEALGGHVQQCDSCGHSDVAYNSCRNRHCPKCLGHRAAQWLEAREQDLLPVPYFHVVFTIPRQLHPWFRSDHKQAYGLLFKAVAETLKEVARNPDNLGAELGFTAVLHTWTQRLLFHPHVHCVVTGGGLDATRRRWVSPAQPDTFLVSVKKLSLVFRGKLLRMLELATQAGEVQAPRKHKRLLIKAARRDWVVYAKRPFAGPAQVLKYLSRYTHRIALTNSRLLAMDGNRVTLSWKDRRAGDVRKTMTLSAHELIRRFLQHVLPKGFHRLRHYGLLSNGGKKKWLAVCRTVLGATPPPAPEPDPDPDPDLVIDAEHAAAAKDTRCPRCKHGRMLCIKELPSLRARRRRSPQLRGPP